MNCNLSKKVRSWSKKLFLTFLLLNYSYSYGIKVVDIIESKANEWNIANNTQDFVKLNGLFAEEVVFYGKRMSVAECLKKKEKIFNKFTPYAQVIVSEYTIEEYSDDLVKCTFSKRVAFDNKTKTYPSYLFFKKIDQDYKIVEEGDEITNSNLNYTSDYESYKNDSKIGWAIPLMIVFSTLALGFLLYKLFKQKKAPKEDIILPKQENNNIADNSDESTRKGREFEKYVVSLFDRNFFSIVHAQSDKSFDGRHVETNQNPDFVLRLETNSGWANIGVECKYRSKVNKNYPIQFCEDYQLRNYQNFGYANEMNVFIVLGIGGTPSKPEEMYVFPIFDLRMNTMSYNALKSHFKRPGSSFFYDMNDGTLR